jgi:hypothetical protein
MALERLAAALAASATRRGVLSGGVRALLGLGAVAVALLGFPREARAVTCTIFGGNTCGQNGEDWCDEGESTYPTPCKRLESNPPGLTPCNDCQGGGTSNCGGSHSHSYCYYDCCCSGGQVTRCRLCGTGMGPATCYCSAVIGSCEA